MNETTIIKATRPKTQFRLNLEEFLADKAEHRDDWFSVFCAGIGDVNKYRSTAYNLKRRGYNIGIIEYDPANKVLWISRKE